MTAEVVELVFSRSWELRDALRSATAAEVEAVRTELKELLARVAAAEVSSDDRGFLGSAYPLVCWIDHLMTTDPRVSRLWKGRELEQELFASDDRDWMFWQQAKLAETLERYEALEIFFLCVAHGFTGRRLKGEPDDQAAALRNWMERMRTAVSRVPKLDLPCDSRLAPPPEVPPLYGRRALRSMLAVGWIATALLLPTLSFWAARTWMLS